MIYRYPTKRQLAIIENWSFQEKGRRELLDYLKKWWWYPQFNFCVSGTRIITLTLHTGGWSGNEAIIEALQNSEFWLFYWRESRRGGHYIFKIPKKHFAWDKERSSG